MEQPSSIITNAYLRLYKNLQEIEVEVIQFTNLPTDIDTHSLNVLAQDIEKKFVFSRNLLNAEIKSGGSNKPEDLVEVEKRLVELEAEFNQSYNWLLLPNVVPHDVDNDDNVSVCESCLNDGGELERMESNVSSVYDQVPEILYDPLQEKTYHESIIMPPSSPEKVETRPNDCRKEKSRGWWLRRMVVVAGSAVLMVGLLSYFDNKKYEGFLTPT